MGYQIALIAIEKIHSYYYLQEGTEKHEEDIKEAAKYDHEGLLLWGFFY